MSGHSDLFKEANIDAALFPVELRPVWVPLSDGQLTEVSRYHAVVDVEKNHVFSVVASDYKLVLNQKALDLGRQCFDSIFRLTSADEMRPYNLVMPKTRSFCHVDFVHPEASFDFYDDDPWTPFLRVTNSYNRMFALNFDLGFCRGFCKNGLIVGKQSIKFKYTHSKRSERDPKAEFALRAGKFAQQESEFLESLRNLKRFHVPTDLMWALFCKVFRFAVVDEDDATPQQLLHWRQRKKAVCELTEKYFGALGQNGYAALNVLTDYASRPSVEISADQRVNILQTYSGEWVTEFVSQMERRDFDFHRYLGEYAVLVA